MSRVVNAVPGMEKFIREVCNLVISIHSPPEYDDSSLPILQRVIPSIKRWLADLRDLRSTRNTIEDIERILQTRSGSKLVLFFVLYKKYFRRK